MAKPTQPKLGKELKELGVELGAAFKQMTQSKEFKHLQSEIATGVKSISKSLLDSLRAAKESESTKRLQKKFGRVVKASAVQGKIEAEKAQGLAAQKLRKIREAIQKHSKN